MHRRRLLFCALSCLACVGITGRRASSAEPLDPQRWEEDIQRFEAQDQKEMPAPGGVLFVGSSSIVRWNLEEAFPELKAINRGFGGSEVADSLHFADRIILPYRPRTIVFYAGDNDIANGKSAEQVAKDFARLAAKIHEGLPEARLLFLAIKPSRARWELIDVQREANRLVAAQAEGADFLRFVDLASPLLGDDGLPREDLFEDDKLHINAAGYEVWNALLCAKLAPK
ncbi:MAG: SGNH/GDSL hydrolase family protein [Planctomycetia bacterium]|nr:SGNH/GDSL hydrolase family protein [Planctomycetia bacterium]